MQDLHYLESSENEYKKLGINLFYTFGLFNNFYSSKLKKFGLTTYQYNILRILKMHQPNAVSINIIQHCMPDKRSDVSRLIERMRLKGLVERQICAQDRRKVDVTIKPKGLKLLQKIEYEEIEWDKEFFTMDENEVCKLNQLLENIKR
jgi:DNA-binding MarR family transcriptional regulator